MFFSSTKEINGLISEVCFQVKFWGALTPADIIEFSNFLLQLKNQSSGNKTAAGFSIILILKGVMTF